MMGWRVFVVLGSSFVLLGQQTAPNSSPDDSVMLAAVSRDSSMLAGGLSTGKWTGRGTAYVEPLARITPSGDWVSVPCGGPDPRSTCRKFEREYLKKAHAYTVISADGEGARVQAAPTTLDECWGYLGTGTYDGAPIARAAIAASSTDIFATSAPLQLLDKTESVAIRKALSALIPAKLDSPLYLRLYSLRLEGRDLVVVQRSYSDFAGKHEERSLKFAFSIGAMEQGKFRLLYWNRPTQDDDEQVIGTIGLKSGREFLISTVSDTESQVFRVYGIRDGKLVVVYKGGGSSC